MSGPSSHDGSRALAVFAAVLMATGVALGAFGAHALEATVTPSRLAAFETGVRYQLIHGVGLLVIASRQRVVRAGWLLGVGAALFASSLYVLVLTDTPWLGAVAPVGGAAMISGWCWLAWELVRSPRGGGAAQ